jgi:hypothetical protein
MTITIEDYKNVLASLDTGLVIMIALTAGGVLAYPIVLPRLRVNFWVWLMPLAVLVRLPRFGTEFWYDETYTALMSSLNPQNFATALLSDVHPPGHYLIARFMRLFGDSDVLLRLPSLFAGMLLIYLAHRFAKRVTDYKTAFWVAILVAFLPAFVHYSAEARYPIFLACAVVGMAIGANENRRVVFVLCAMGAIMTHNLGMVYVIVLCIYALTKYRSWAWVWAIGGVGIVVCAWLPIFILQATDVANGFWLIGRNPLWLYIDMTVLGGLPPWVIVTYPVFIGVTVFGCFRTFYGANRVWLLIGIGVPALLAVISQVKPVYLERAMIASAVMVVVVWAWVCARSIAWRVAILFSLVLVNVGYFSQMADDDAVTLTKVFANCDGASAVYTFANNITIMATHFTDLPVYTHPRSDNLHQQLSADAKTAMGLKIINFDDLRGDICVVISNDYYTGGDAELFMLMTDPLYPPVHMSDSPVYEYVIYRVAK